MKRTILSVCNWPLTATRDYSENGVTAFKHKYEIPAVPKGEYKLLTVTDLWDRMHVSEGQYSPLPVYGEHIADDLVEEWTGDMAAGRPGCIVLKGDGPTTTVSVLTSAGAPEPGENGKRIVAQLARIGGCRVIGVAGGADKCRMLVDDYGLDAAIDYRSANFAEDVAKVAPGGIDVVWDNVGGTILNTLLGNLAMGARVVICGGISRSKTGGMPVGPENYFNLVFKRATMRGFILMDHENLFDEARRRMSGWLADGRLIAREDIQEGFENAPRTLMRLFSGKNVGKQLLRLTTKEGGQ